MGAAADGTRRETSSWTGPSECVTFFVVLIRPVKSSGSLHVNGSLCDFLSQSSFAIGIFQKGLFAMDLDQAADT